MRPPSFILISCILFCISTDAQVSPDRFVVKVNAQLIVRTVSVNDRKGHPIEGLTAGDFTVTEDGVPQTINVFEFQKMDDTRIASHPPASPKTIGNAGKFPITSGLLPEPAETIGSMNQRLLIFYFDFAAVSQIERNRVLRAAREFIELHRTASDRLAILTYSQGAVKLLQEFTDDGKRLLETIRMLRDREYYDEGSIQPQFGQNEGVFDIFNTDRRLMALQTTVRMFESLRATKSLIYFSGSDKWAVENQAQLLATLNSAVRANVSIYPIDSRGLSAFAPMGNASQHSPGGVGMYSGSIAMDTMRIFQRSQDFLYTLAVDTGGKALLDSNDLTQGIVKVQRASSSYYVIGYYPTNTAQDGRARRIKISLKGRSADLFYRNAYYAGKDFSRYTDADKERQLEDALLLEDPISEIPIAMELNYFKINKTKYFVPLSVNIPGSELLPAQEAGADRIVLDFIGEIRDALGATITNLRDKAEIELKGNAASRLISSPLHYDTAFTLPSGRYMLKFLVRNAVTGRIGTYQALFTVPDLNNENLQLPISSVVLSSQRIPMNDALFSVGGDKNFEEQRINPLVHDGQKLIPSIARVFHKAQPLYVYLEAYARGGISTEKLGVFVAFYREQEKVFETPVYKTNDPQQTESGAVPVKLVIALEELPAGAYTCQVTALYPKGQKVAFRQTQVLILP